MSTLSCSATRRGILLPALNASIGDTAPLRRTVVGPRRARLVEKDFSPVRTSLFACLINQIESRRPALTMERIGENSLRVMIRSLSNQDVIVTGDEDSLIVHVGQYAHCRFALGDYEFARDPMRPWYAVTDAIGLLEDLAAAAPQ